MTTRSIRILCEIEFASTTERLWDGSGPYVDGDGDVWRGCASVTGLDVVEAAINGEAYTLEIALTGVPSDIAGLAFEEYDEGEIIGSTIRLMIQACDEYDQPDGVPEVRFTGMIDNIRFDDVAQDDEVRSTIVIECTNRFSLRRLTSGAVLSDTDQRARAALTNPAGNPDRFCERVPTLRDKQIAWPRFN